MPWLPQATICGAAASIGVVRTAHQNDGQSIRVLGSRRVVIAVNPDEDDPELLRTVLMLLRTVAITASLRTGTAEVETAEKKITELTHLEKVDAVKKDRRHHSRGRGEDRQRVHVDQQLDPPAPRPSARRKSHRVVRSAVVANR